jgi:hypothetical protein
MRRYNLCSIDFRTEFGKNYYGGVGKGRATLEAFTTNFRLENARADVQVSYSYASQSSMVYVTVYLELKKLYVEEAVLPT